MSLDYFQRIDTLMFASKHAKGMSLRYDSICLLSPIVADLNCRICHANVVWMSFYLTYWIIIFLRIGFSPKASGFCPFGDATDLEESGDIAVVCLIQALCLKSDMPQC